MRAIQAGGTGCASDRSVRRGKGRLVGREGGDPRGERRVLGHRRGDGARAIRRQFAIDEGVQLRLADRNFAHRPSSGSAAGSLPASSAARSATRARASRDITVPIGTASSSAISR